MPELGSGSWAEVVPRMGKYEWVLRAGKDGC